MALRQSLRTMRIRPLSVTTSRQSSSGPTFETLLAKPSWSVRSLLPSSTSSLETITPKTLHHLLRLSALPQPSSAEEESQMLSTLESQLHFVHAIREVDTTGIEPLRAIRDETAQGLREQTIGLEQLRDTLSKEDVVGHAQRPRRRRGEAGQKENINHEVEGWDVLDGASETAGRYFVVRTGSSSSAQMDVNHLKVAKET